MDTIARTKLWMETAIPEPKSKNLHTQLGVHFEEVLEMLEALETSDLETQHIIMHTIQSLNRLQAHLKKSDGVIELHGEKRVALLDALCDQIVTAVGVAHNFRMDIVGGLQEVNRSNFSKFSEDGQPYFNEDLKIIKGPRYTPADLHPFADFK